MKTKSFKQKVIFKGATPKEVYDALMDSKKHARFTDGAAKISKKIGGDFSVFDGYAVGKNLVLIEGKKIVQSWRANEEGWDQEHYSEITFDLKKVKGGTELTFTHKNVPDEKVNSIKQGWKDYYWHPLKKMLEK